MKVRVDSYAWVDKRELTSIQLQRLRSELTVVPDKVGDFGGGLPAPIHLFQETETEIGLAREYFFRPNIRRGHDLIWNTTSGAEWPSPLKFNGELRAAQLDALHSIAKTFRDRNHCGGMLEAKPGMGKTVLTCAMIAELQIPTLVVVHKQFLASQWKERIEQFLPDAKIGRVQQDVCDFEGNHVVIGMVHSLAAKQYPAEFYDWPGMIVVDECFVEGTLIRTDEGLRPIEEIQAGDVVENACGKGRVLDAWSRLCDPISLVQVVGASGSKIVCTENHPFLTDRGWVRAGNLVAGDKLVGRSNVLDRTSRAPGFDSPGLFGPRKGFEDMPRSLRLHETLRTEFVSAEQVSRVPSSEEPPFPAVDTVEAVQAIERGEPVNVWNLEVSGHPSYVLENGAVVHNCHRIGAQTWAPVPSKFRAQYRLGLSATIRRKDNAENVFLYTLGPILHRSKEQRLTPKVRRVWTDFRMVRTDKFNPNLAKKPLLLRFLCSNPTRNEAIVEQIALALEKGRKILVLSERIEHLQRLEHLLEQKFDPMKGPAPVLGYYIGGMSEDARNRSAKAQVILASVQYAEEGLDIPALDTLILATPLSDVEQAVGRILRPCEGKRDPVIVDFRDDNIPQFKRTAEYRDRYYAQLLGG